MPTQSPRLHTHRSRPTEGWQLGDDFTAAVSRPHRLRTRSPIQQSPLRNRVTFLSILGISTLVHLSLLWLYFSQQGNLPSPSEPAPTTALALIELSPVVDTATSLAESRELQALQSFHTNALERTNALEHTLSETLRQNEAAKAARQQHLAGLETERTMLSGQLETLTVEKADLAARLANEQQRLVELEEQLETERRAREQEVAGVKGAYNQLVAALQGEIAQNNIALRQARQRLVVSILDRVLFPSGQAALTPDGQRILDKVAAILPKLASQRIQIEGHTDNVPISPTLSARFPSNWELSAARATEVVRYLLTRAQLPADRLSAVGRADTAPVASNTTDEGRAHNRRIEIIVLPSEDPTKELS